MNKRNYSIDTLKFFCILGVICLHAVPYNEIMSGRVGNKYLAFVLNTLSRVCVPLFFMITGYLFYSRSSLSYTKKRIINCVKMLIGWTFIYIVYDLMMINIMTSRPLFNGAKAYIKQFKIENLYYGTGIVNYHLWYITAMIFIIPVLYLIIRYSIVNKSLILALILNIIGVFVPAFIDGSSWIKFRDAAFFGLFYSLLGVYIKKNEDEFCNKFKKISNIKYIVLTLTLLAASIIERYIYAYKFKGGGNYFLTTIPISILIFAFCIINTNRIKESIISRIGKRTLGVYLIHPMIIMFLTLLFIKLGINRIRFTGAWQILCMPIVLAISYIIYMVYYKLKKLLYR